ncbi:hypothetical protein [Thermocrispum sp.]|uniref:Uncharacterized protein n=1 Tax=Thermocrispum agreste TaxID=37925 RepID=A0A2W4JF72_9PSEU|nr:hypothetical protein [Thermocrispum sp.]PZM97131.1 MAG: hypothetical protein DIU77_09740 [Thermocrispum agreste]
MSSDRMPERYRDDPATPVPADIPTGTLFAALYADSPVEVGPVPEGQQDHFSLFVAYSAAMGWLSDDDHRGLWSMNDAGGPRSGGDKRLCAWFQVGISQVPASRPLPVQPFLQCTGTVNARLGGPPAAEVLLLLPVQCLGTRSRHAVPAMRTVGWFEAVPPEARVSAEVQVSIGRAGSREALNAAVADFLHLDQPVLTSPTTAAPSAAPTPPFDDTFWDGPATTTIALHGTLVSWEPVTLGWVAQALAECAAANDLGGSLLVTFLRRQ